MRSFIQYFSECCILFYGANALVLTIFSNQTRPMYYELQYKFVTGFPISFFSLIETISILILTSDLLPPCILNFIHAISAGSMFVL